MKKFRTTFILIFLGLALWVYLEVFDPRIAGTDDAPQVIAVDRSTLIGLTIQNGEGTMEFSRTNGTWFLESPIKDRADDESLVKLFTTVEGLDMNLRKVPEPKGKDIKEIQKELGVAKGDVSIKFTEPSGGRKPLELFIGKKTAVEGKVYARINGADAIYTLPSEIRDQLSKGVKDWRDRKLAAISVSEVNKVILKTAKGEIEAGRKSGNWSLVRPLKARADNQRINDLIANAASPRIEDFIPDSKDLSTLGLTEPRVTVVLYIEGGKEPVTIQVGANKKGVDDAKPLAYVKVSTRAGVVTAPAAIESLALTLPNDLRDASLIRVQADIVDRITLEGGGSKIIIGRDGESWKRKSKPEEPVNSIAAKKLLDDLTTAKSVRFVEDVGSDLKKYGLDQPTATVTLSSYSTEGTPETTPGDKPIARLLIGNPDGNTDTVFAKLDDEPYIVAVSKLLTENIWTDPLQWQELRLYDNLPADIVHLEITKAEQPAITLDLGQDKLWKLAKGDGTVNQIAVQSLINTLSTLRAVRWAGATKATEQGLEKPAITVTFTLADKKTGKLRIGSMNSDRLRHALIEGKTGTALLNRPDVSAFEAALIEGQKPPTDTPTPPTNLSPEPLKPAAPPKTQEAPAGETKPAPEPSPK